MAKKIKPKIGMYGETPKIRIGGFVICDAAIPDNGSVWIEGPDGDGGEFGKAALEPFLKDFFDKHL